MNFWYVFDTENLVGGSLEAIECSLAWYRKAAMEAWVVGAGWVGTGVPPPPDAGLCRVGCSSRRSGSL